jgi:cell division septal protein FtsQ
LVTQLILWSPLVVLVIILSALAFAGLMQLRKVRREGKHARGQS